MSQLYPKQDMLSPRVALLKRLLHVYKFMDAMALLLSIHRHEPMFASENSTDEPLAKSSRKNATRFGKNVYSLNDFNCESRGGFLSNSSS